VCFDAGSECFRSGAKGCFWAEKGLITALFLFSFQMRILPLCLGGYKICALICVNQPAELLSIFMPDQETV